jgi:hypothetical protein
LPPAADWASGTSPRYNKTRCFETFPFPPLDDPLDARIRQLGEEMDGPRRQRQALHPGLTLTGMCNVLERLRRGEPLAALGHARRLDDGRYLPG